jgi:ketosteroid isomerase-like protein
VKRTPYVVLLVCLGGSVTAAFANSTASPTDRSADEAAIRKIDVAWSHAAETKDIDGTVAPYDADGSVLPFNAPIATGTAAIRQVWSSLMSKPGFHLTFAPTKIVIAGSGDMAWEVGTFELILNDAQGNPMTMLGKYVVTWKKLGGTWKVAADIFNTDK